jgi:hypothetical protein
VRLRYLVLPYFLLSLAVVASWIVVPDPNSADDTFFWLTLLGLGAVSVGVGFAAGRWKAIWLTGAVFLAALAVDFLSGARVIDRSAEFHPVAVSFGIVFWDPWLLPGLATLIGAGVAIRRGVDGRRWSEFVSGERR